MAPPELREQVRSELPTIDPRLYKIGEEIAHGGMGRIRAAKDLRLGREVAIKELLEPSGELAARFEREVRVTARLQHPAIVAVYEAGRWPSGEPFFAMKLVHGRSLKRAIAEATTFEARLALLPHAIAVADAMAYAHARRIIHRDLKPANVLVGELGETVVIDWGIAKDLAADEREEPMRGGRPRDANLTRVGSVMGTPSYMAPEQARGETLDERADVYAIGAILYHLLGGAPPFIDSDSGVLMTKVATEPPEPLASRAPGIARDLVAIVERAMARHRAERYPTARELAEDLRRFQTGQLVASHHYTRGQLVRRFAGRHRVALGIASVAAIVLGVGAAISIVQIRDERDLAQRERIRASDERGIAERERATALQRLDALIVEKASVAIDRGEPRTALATLSTLSPGSSQLAYARFLAAAAFGEHIPRVTGGLGEEIRHSAISSDGARIAIAGERTVRLIDLATGIGRPLGGHEQVIEELEFSPDGKLLASTAFGGHLKIWDLATGRDVELVHEKPVDWVGFVAGDERVLTVAGDARLRLWDLATGQVQLEVPGARNATLLGNTLYWTFGDLHILDLTTRRERIIKLAPATGMNLAGDGSRVALGHEDGTISVLEIADGKERVLGRHGTGLVNIVAFSPDYTTIMSVGVDHEIRAWPVSGGAARSIGVDPAVQTSAGYLGVSAAGTSLLSAGQPWRLWELASGGSVALASSMSNLRFTADGGRVTGLVGHEVWSWPVVADERVVAHFDGPAHQVAYIPDGRLLSVASDRMIIEGEAAVVLPVRIVGRLAVARDRFAMLGADGIVRVLDPRTHAVRELPGTLAAVERTSPADPKMSGPDFWTMRRVPRQIRDHEGWIDPLVFSPDGTRLAGAGTTGGTIRIWTVATGAAVTLDVGADVEQLAYTPDGATVIAACSDGRLHAIAVADGRDRAWASGDPIEAIAVSPDGGAVIAASTDHHLRRWTIASGAGEELVARDASVSTVALSSDGRWLASGASDYTVRIDDLRDRRSVDVGGHSGAILALAFGAGQVISADWDGTVRLFELAAGHGRTLASHGSKIGSLAISPDGKRFAAAGADGIVREWSDAVPPDEAGLHAWIAARLAD